MSPLNQFISPVKATTPQTTPQQQVEKQREILVITKSDTCHFRTYFPNAKFIFQKHTKSAKISDITDFSNFQAIIVQQRNFILNGNERDLTALQTYVEENNGCVIFACSVGENDKNVGDNVTNAISKQETNSNSAFINKLHTIFPSCEWSSKEQLDSKTGTRRRSILPKSDDNPHTLYLTQAAKTNFPYNLHLANRRKLDIEGTIGLIKAPLSDIILACRFLLDEYHDFITENGRPVDNTPFACCRVASSAISEEVIELSQPPETSARRSKKSILLPSEIFSSMKTNVVEKTGRLIFCGFDGETIENNWLLNKLFHELSDILKKEHTSPAEVVEKNPRSPHTEISKP